MPKKGPKIKELAAEFGLTSRVLIDRCRGEGLPVQNSLTRMGPEHERLIRSWFDNDESENSTPPQR